MEFIVNCYSEYRGRSTNARAVSLRKCCDMAGIRCQEWPHSGMKGDFLCSVIEPQNDVLERNVFLLQLNILVSFCALHYYSLIAVPDSPFEEFLSYYRQKLKE